MTTTETTGPTAPLRMKIRLEELAEEFGAAEVLRFATELWPEEGWTRRDGDTQTEPATVPDGRLVCPHCHSGDYLGSLETSSTEYGIRLTGVGGKVEVEYPGEWTRSYDEGTEYVGDIWCNHCRQQLTESELVAYQTPQEREDAES